MKTKEKTFGELKVGDDFYMVNIEHCSITKKKVLCTSEDTNGMVILDAVHADSTDYENDSLVMSFPKNYSSYGRFKIYTTTIEIAKKSVRHWERTSKKEIKKEIKEKANRMMDLLNNCEL